MLLFTTSSPLFFHPFWLKESTQGAFATSSQQALQGRTMTACTCERNRQWQVQFLAMGFDRDKVVLALARATTEAIFDELLDILLANDMSHMGVGAAEPVTEDTQQPSASTADSRRVNLMPSRAHRPWCRGKCGRRSNLVSDRFCQGCPGRHTSYCEQYDAEQGPRAASRATAASSASNPTACASGAATSHDDAEGRPLLGYLVLGLPAHLRRWLGFHPTSWDDLCRRLGFSPTVLSGRLAKHGVYLRRIYDIADANRLWPIDHATRMPRHDP